VARNDQTTKASEGLEHPQGGRVTRDDPGDLGVPMLPGDPSEPQGPEDALGAGPKRGDYTGRIGPATYHPHTTEAIPASERETDDDGNPTGVGVRVVAQRPRAEDIGDESGLKGGVETDPVHPIQRGRR